MSLLASSLQSAAGAASLAPGGEVRSSAESGLALWGDYSLADPLFLLFLPIAAVALIHGRRRRASQAARMSMLPPGRLPRSWPQRLAWIPIACQLLALAGVAVALARPLRGNVLSTTEAEGVDIALVVDRSGSMKFEDLAKGLTRLDVVKRVVGDFARRRMTDTVGASDYCALFTFAQYPQLLCPFTLDADALTGFLDQVELVRFEAEDGTGIGRALAKSVAVLRESDAKSRVVVLLTDGENNIDDISPIEAAELAAEEGVRVYTVLAGRFVYVQSIFGVQASEQEIDSSELEQIARMTGGRFFRARNEQGLEDVYAEIERLERTPRTERTFTETFDLYPLVLLPALIAYLIGWLSSASWARRLP